MLRFLFLLIRTSYILHCCHKNMLNIQRQDGLSCNYVKNKIDRLRRMWFVRTTTTTGKGTENARKKMNKSHESWRDVRGIYELSTIICHLYMSSQTVWYCSDWMCKNSVRLAEENSAEFSFRLFFSHLVFHEYFVQQHSSEPQAPSIHKCDVHAFNECNEHWPGLTVRCVCVCVECEKHGT